MGGGVEGQTYCLRWNNHKSNLVEILDVLIQKECYVDCTIYVDGQEQFKAHRVVLAANSPYFQSILQDVPMDHCSILVPGVQAFEMRALIEYMYTGEVNVTESQIPRIMKIAEQLEVKGLFDMTDLKDKFERFGGVAGGAVAGLMSGSIGGGAEESSNNGTTTSVGSHQQHHTQQQQQQPQHHYNNSNGKHSGGSAAAAAASSPIISTSSTTNVSQAQSSSASPPAANTNAYNSYKLPYPNLLPNLSQLQSDSERAAAQSAWSANAAVAAAAAHHHHQQQQQQQQHHMTSPLPALHPPPPPPHLQNAAAAMLSSVYESGSDMNPLKRKKISSITSMLMSRDTPILRNVLAQSNAADSSQPPVSSCDVSGGGVGLNRTPIMNDRSDRHSTHSNGTDYSDKHKIKNEDPHSPYTDKSFDDDAMEPSQNYPTDSRIASYVPQQKPEWKRYKQYTRADILAAIDCVRKGMSALKASRQFGVPSRTLYDKVKKLGITTGRPMNRTSRRSPSNGGCGGGGGGGGVGGGGGGGVSPAGFPYGISGTSSPYGAHHHDAAATHPYHHHDSSGDRDPADREHQNMTPTISQPAAALIDARFLQHALEAGGGDIAGREALHAMAFAAAAHAAVNGMSTSPGTHGTARSPSPSILMKCMRPTAAAAVDGGSPSSAASLLDHHRMMSSSTSPPNISMRHHQPPAHHHQPMDADDGDDDDDDDDVDDDDNDHVEDLSMTKKAVTTCVDDMRNNRPQQQRSPSPPARQRSSTPPPSSPQMAPSSTPHQTGVIVQPVQTKVISHCIDDSVLNMKRETVAAAIGVVTAAGEEETSI